jgi:GT2 family glycosyltransferase
VSRVSGDSATNSPPRVYGLLCTFSRSQVALDYLDVLDRQTLRLDRVYVVDNSSDSSLRESLNARPATSIPVIYLDPGANLGPAGAFSVGFESLQDSARSDDVVIHLDDDDPPVVESQIERLVGALVTARAADASIGGIGLSGGNLRRRMGTIKPTPDAVGLVEVDHLHGGYLPCYTVAALVAVGGNDAAFFYGFEELELGRRLHGRGYRLMVDLDTAREASGRYPKKSSQDGSAQRTSAEGDWSRFHKERNLIRILKREGFWTAVAFTVMARHVAKPIWIMLRRPRAGWNRFTLGLRATRAGLRGETGIDRRYPPHG